MPKEKLRVLEAIYAIDKTDPEVILSILKIARSERNWSKCERISDEALELYPLSPEMYYFNGVSKYKLGKLDSAEEILVTGRDIIIDDPKLLSDILSILGSVYYKKNEWSEAQLSLDAALIQNPENMSALNNYAYYMAKKNTNLNQALSYAQVANELSKNNGVYLDTYGFVLFRLKRYSDAEKAFKLAFDLLPDDAEVAEHYGDCLAVVDKIEEAMKYWQIALQLGSSSNNLKLKIESKKFIE
jgi:tetratricopeptide (TPR) repeat protein